MRVSGEGPGVEEKIGFPSKQGDVRLGVWGGRGMNEARAEASQVPLSSPSWVAFEYPDFQGQQFILEKGDYPRWSAWSGSAGHHSDQLLSFRPVLCAVSTALPLLCCSLAPSSRSWPHHSTWERLSTHCTGVCKHNS